MLFVLRVANNAVWQHVPWPGVFKALAFDIADRGPE
jgi:hypothetical protein